MDTPTGFNFRFTVNDTLAALADRFNAHVPDDVLDELTHHVADTLAKYRHREDVPVFTGAHGDTFTEADDVPTTFGLEYVVGLLAQRHPEVIAYIENTGGGVMCILAA